MGRDWVIKSISITKEDAEIAARVGNLSKFTRACLRRWAAWSEGEGKHATPSVFNRAGACPPQTGCLVCWPGGAPLMHHWDMFMGVNPDARDLREGSGVHREYIGPEVGNLEWLRAQVPETFSIRDIDATGNATPEARSKPKSRSIISKMLKFLGK